MQKPKNLPDNLLFLSAQPNKPNYLWEVEVQIVNFRKFDIPNRMNVLVWYSIQFGNLGGWEKLAQKYPEVSFYFYKDTGANVKIYPPQTRPHILVKHFDKFPELKDKIIFYHDADIIFHYLPDFGKLCTDDVNWQSQTSNYLDYNYLRKKEKEGKLPEEESIDVLCKIGNITKDTFKQYTGRMGGAQYILKNIDADIWRDVERQTVLIRKAFKFGQPESINSRYFKSEAAGFQSWCADMWALNMALWSRNRKTEVTSELDFSWANKGVDDYLKKPIFHNAGVPLSKRKPGVFCKHEWRTKSPIGQNLTANPDSATFFYIKAINEVK